jgi:hypothetical protein
MCAAFLVFIITVDPQTPPITWSETDAALYLEARNIHHSAEYSLLTARKSARPERFELPTLRFEA